MTSTAMIVTAAVIILAIYDLWAVTFGGVGSSISRMMQRAGLKHPFIVFAIGFLCGHIFGYMAPESSTAEPAPVVHAIEKQN